MGCKKLTYEARQEPSPFLTIWKKGGQAKTNLSFFVDPTEKNTAKKIFDNYYPFGLTFNERVRAASVSQNFLFNQGVERINDFGLNWDMAFFRVSDPTIGRWLQIDPISKAHESPYAWVTNNPIRFMDYLGLDTVSSSAPNFDWDDVQPGDVVDGVAVLDQEVTVEGTNQSSSTPKPGSGIVRFWSNLIGSQRSQMRDNPLSPIPPQRAKNEYTETANQQNVGIIQFQEGDGYAGSRGYYETIAKEYEAIVGFRLKFPGNSPANWYQRAKALRSFLDATQGLNIFGERYPLNDSTFSFNSDDDGYYSLRLRVNGDSLLWLSDDGDHTIFDTKTNTWVPLERK